MTAKFVIRLVLAASLMAMFATAQTREKEPGPAPRRAPWEWTDSERWASLQNEGEAAARVQVHLAERSRVASSAAAEDPRPYDVIDGNRDPHLFLRWELFSHLASAGYAQDANFRQVWREMREKARRDAGLPDTFWNEFEVISAAYRASRRRQRDLYSSTLGPDERTAAFAAIRAEICRDSSAAIAEADARFGPAFDRFLYLGVAPRLHAVWMKKPDADYHALVMGECPRAPPPGQRCSQRSP